MFIMTFDKLDLYIGKRLIRRYTKIHLIHRKRIKICACRVILNSCDTKNTFFSSHTII